MLSVISKGIRSRAFVAGLGNCLKESFSVFIRVDTLRRAGCTRSTEKRHRRISPGLERLEDRSLLTKIVDLGTLVIPYAINSSGEVVGISASGTGAFSEYPPGNPIYLTPPKPNEGLTPRALNEVGEIVGDSNILGIPAGAFADIMGQPTGLAGASEATGINGSGDVVGSSGSVPFLWNATTGMQLLETLGLGGSAMGINDSGQVVGNSGDTAVLWNPGEAPQDLGTLGGSELGGYVSGATAINNAGQVVGWSLTNVRPGPTHAFLWSPGSGMKDLGAFPYATNSYATGINNSGVVVGYVQNGPGGPPSTDASVPHPSAFIYENGRMTDLNSLLPQPSNWYIVNASGINNEGVVVGIGYHNGGIHGYELFTSGGTMTTTSLQASSPNAVYGQPVTLTATVRPTAGASGNPGGSVTFFCGTIDVGTAPLSGGTATLKVGDLPLGTDAITASYGGDSEFAASQSTPLDVTFGKDGTSVSLSSSANPASVGQAITFTAIVSPVSPGAGAPTGTVTFTDGTGLLNSVALTGGEATCSISTLAPGKHMISAVYSGDSSFLTSTSYSLYEVIGKPTIARRTQLTLAASPKSPVFGQAVTFTVVVSTAGNAKAVPTGSVSFMDGSAVLGTVRLSGGRAKLTTKTLSAGTHTIRVVYRGDIGFAPTSASLKQRVKQAKTSKSKFA
jgi:probable HAF family extracellular repeat protein